MKQKSVNYFILKGHGKEEEYTGLSLKCVSAADCLKYFQEGCLFRKTTATKLNKQSSRSHAIFRISVKDLKEKDSKIY